MRHPRIPPILVRMPWPPNRGNGCAQWNEVDVSDEQHADEPMRRPRGRHRGLPAGAAAPAGDGWRARLSAAMAPVVASVEPRAAAAAEWLFERRLHVLIVAATVATIAMIGGAVALISFAGAPGPADEAATVVETPRPTSDDPDSGNTLRADPAESRSSGRRRRPRRQARRARCEEDPACGGRTTRDEPTTDPTEPPADRGTATDPSRPGRRTSPKSPSPNPGSSSSPARHPHPGRVADARAPPQWNPSRVQGVSSGSARGIPSRPWIPRGRSWCAGASTACTNRGAPTRPALRRCSSTASG